MKNKVLKNIFYPIFILIAVVIIALLFNSCSMTFSHFDLNNNVVNGLVFSSRDSTHLLIFSDDEALEKIDDFSSSYSYLIYSDKKVAVLTKGSVEKNVYFYSLSKILDEESSVFLYEVQL